MSDALASTPRPNSCTRTAHCPAPINHQPPCCGARPSGVMSKAEEVTIIPFKAADHSQGRSRLLDRGYANFYEKAQFVKADVAATVGGRAQRLLSALRAMLLSALSVSLSVTRCI
jgi:hypothetical protein